MSRRKPLKITMGPENSETPMIEQYWNEIRGTLCAEFKIAERRKLDAVILPNGKDKEVKNLPLNGQNVIVVQAKAKRLSMYLMGQTLFSAELVRRFYNPTSIRSIALCKKADPYLSSLLVSVGKKVGVDVEVKECLDPDARPPSESPGSRGIHMIQRYRDEVGGTLYRKFPKNMMNGQHFIHAVIVPSETNSRKEILGQDIPKGQEVIVVHAKSKQPTGYYRLGMYIMGQALFGAALVKQECKLRSIRSIVLCDRDDDILHPILKDIGEKVGIEMEVVVVPKLASK